MKTTFLKSIWLFALLLCSSVAALGEDVVQIGDVFYRLSENEIWVDSHNDDEGNWVAGAYVTDYSATVTNNPAINPWDTSNYDEKYQGDLVIPETVNYNDQVYQVRGCDGSAFCYAHNLTSISFPKTITSIEYYNLRDLNNLTAIIVDPENPSYTAIDGVLYNKEVTNVLVFPRMRGGIYRVPSTITEFVGLDNIVIGRPNIDELIIPATVTKIGSNTFDYGTIIRKVTIEDGDTELTIGTGYNCWWGNDENGNSIELRPMFGSCGVQEVYWGRNVKPTNKYSSPFAYNNINKVTFGPKVTAIPQYSFCECYSLSTVDLLGGIGQWLNFDFSLPYTNPLSYNYGGGTVLFNGAALSGDVVIPDDVTVIPSHAFQFDCSGVNNLLLPAGLTSIADGAFNGMTSLSTIQLAAGNTNFVVIDNVLYNREISKILCFPKLRTGDYTMPSTITEMVNAQFQSCINLTGITLSANLEAIPDYAFQGCSQLQSISIPASVSTIGNVVFDGCTSLHNLIIEDCDNPLTIGNGMNGFEAGTWDNNGNYNTTSLAPLFYQLPLQEVYWGRNLDFSSAPFARSDVRKISIGPKVTSFAANTFSEWYNLNTVDILGGIAQWCNFDFSQQCSAPFSVTTPTILFNGAPLTGDVILPETVTKIPSHAFAYNCSGVSSLTLPASLTTIADNAFGQLYSQSSVQLADGNTHFVVIDNVLYTKDVSKIMCFPKLRAGDYTIPPTITEIGDAQFYRCANLTGITLSENLGAISNQAFDGCIKIQTLSVPESVKSIGWNAFRGCSSLRELIFEDGTEDLTLGGSDNGLLHDSPIETLHLGRNLNLEFDANSYENLNGSALHNVEISNTVKQIPGGLFRYCNDISQINFLGTIIEWCDISFGNDSATPFWAWAGNGETWGHPCPILHLNGSPLHSQVNIPEGAKKIGSYAFAGQLGVSGVIVPSTVKCIETHAFNGLQTAENGVYVSNVEDVTVSGLSVIPLSASDAFGSNTMIYVDDNITKTYRAADVWSQLAGQICPSGFKQVSVDLIAMENSPALLPALNALEKVNDEYRITALTNLKIKGTMNGWDLLMIRNKMPNLRTLDLEEAEILENDGGAEYYQGYHTRQGAITSYSFYGLKNLQKVILPIGTTEIEPNAFSGSGILTMDIPGTVTNIGGQSFNDCDKLQELTIGKGVETIGWSAFESCDNLRSVNLPSTLRSIESYAFSCCYKLEKLILPTSLRTINSNAFNNCYALREIDFAEGLQTIGYGAFSYCNRLKNLHLPTSLRRIESNAFQYCSSLTEVHVPSMITEIGDYAFKDCGLRAVYAYTVVPVQINQNTFDYDGVDLYAPDNSFYAYYLNTQWSQFLDVKSFPALYTSWYTPRNTDLEIDTKINPIKNANDNDPADASMESGSGLIFVGDGEQLVKGLVMNWQHGSNYPSLIENGNLSVEELRFILNVYPGRWYFFSFPFDVNLKDVKHDGKWVWRYYDGETRAENGSGGWKNVEGDVLKANVGYIYQCNTAGDLELPVNNPEFVNQLTGNTGQKEVPLESYPSADAQNASWNFVGNPNLSYYDLDNVEESGFTAPITVWDDEQQTYTAVVPGDDEYDFHPFQAYFVQTPEDADNLTFEDENRSTYKQTEQVAPARRRAHAARRINENRLLVNLTLTDGETTDKTRVIFNDDNRMDYEAGRDANKFMSMANVPQLYTLDAKNVKYSINARPNGNREVRLGFVASTEGEYTISADRMDCRMALKDNQTGNIHLFDNGDYDFYSEAGTFDNRFTLISGIDAASINSKSIDGLNISVFDGGIVVNGATAGDVTIYKVNGVKATTISGTGTALLPTGTYIVNYDGKSSKVIVK